MARGLGWDLAKQFGEYYVKATYFEIAGSGTTSGTIAKPANSGSDVSFVMDEWGSDTDALVSTVANGKPTFKSPVDSGGSVVTTTFDTAGDYSFNATPVPAGNHAIVFVYKCFVKNFDVAESLFETEIIPVLPGSDHDIVDHADTSALGSELDTLTDWLDNITLGNDGLTTIPQLVLTPRAVALLAVQGAVFFDSDDKSVYVCTEGA